MADSRREIPGGETPGGDRPGGCGWSPGSPEEEQSLTGPWRRGGALDLRVVAVACQAPLSMEFSRQEYWGG